MSTTIPCASSSSLFFFFNDPATTEIYTLSLHDALPIPVRPPCRAPRNGRTARTPIAWRRRWDRRPAPARRRPGRCPRSEEHTSELQSRRDLVCRLLLEKKKHQRKEQQPHSNRQ